MVYHIHKYKFDTLKSTGHNHVLLGYTDGMIGLDKFHFHHYYGVCSYNGHTHYYSGFTSLPVKTEHGHIHKMEGFVEYYIHHEHKYRSYTNEDIEQIRSAGYKIFAIGDR